MPITSTTGTLEGRVGLAKRVIRTATLSVFCAILVACAFTQLHAPVAATPPPHASLDQPAPDTLDAVRARGKLRVVTRLNPASFQMGRHGPSGIEYELASAFATDLGVELEMLPVTTVGEVYAALDAGTADIAASGLTERAHARGAYLYSAPYLDVTHQVVYRGEERRPRSVEDLAGARVMALAHTSSADALRRAQAALPALGWMEATRGDTAELLRMLADGTVDYAVLKSNEFYMYAGLFPRLEIAFELTQPDALAWAVALGEHNGRLYLAIQDFLGKYEADGDLALLRERFFGHLPELNRRAVQAFAVRAEKRLPQLEPLMRRIAAEEGMDWRLLAAMSYQESHWNPRAVSPMGAVGMMMLMQRAASEVGVTNRWDMTQSLRGGARYFLKLVALMDPEIPASERELFALAAYNMGPAHLEDARRIARVRGFDPNRWSDVEAQLPLLSKREWRKHTKYGYARGNETLGFVSRVRQYHRFLVHHDDAAGPLVAMLEQANAAARVL